MMLHDPMLLLEMAVLLGAVGAFAGVLAGLLGVGGGIVLVPAFYYSFSTLGYASPQLMQLCVATSLATIVVTSARSLASHHKQGAVEWSILRGWAPGIVVGAVLGVAVVSQLGTVAMQIVFGTLAFSVGLYMAIGKAHWRLGDEVPTGVTRALLSPLIGGLSVLIGIGGGAFAVPMMTLHGVPIRRAVATASGFGFVIAVPSVIAFMLVSMPVDFRPPLTLGRVNFVAFGLVVAMTALTAPIGARLAHRLDPVLLRRIFAVFLLLVAANMMRKALGW